MRDAHRMKEKFDVSLDNRQIVSLLIAGIVVMGAVFVLGVVVGKKLAGNAQASEAPDLLSALDANAQALQEVQKEPPLTFQDELTRKAAEPSAAEPKPAKPAAPKPAPAATAAATPAPKPTTTAAATPAAKPAPAAPAEKPAEPAAENPATGLSPADEELAALAGAKRSQPAAAAPSEKATPPSAPAAVATPKPAPGPVAEETVPTRTATPAGGGLKEAIARATQRPTEAAPGGAFTLQLSAFQTREEADRFAARLRDRGYAPYIVAAEVPNKGTWYRVRMGSFPTKDAATRYLTDFKRETQLNAFVAGTN
ncbi:SPOR domain-containing protein [Hyalangium gracile]|uniref:SPOR domain-containing protein n=1 Tax=Hyalangium gracile TaxID=394092 RepID=UPI001CCC5A05|nr:SPOR domain-containing protein [Hyalangium gracile]